MKEHLWDRETDTHIYFWGGVFSNFYSVEFEYKGLKFPSTEHAYMWEKAMCFNDDDSALRILHASTPGEAKKLGRGVVDYDDAVWADVRYKIMVDVNMEKWTSRHFPEIILSTNDKTLVEASPVDGIWGVKLHWSDDLILDENNWQGQNLLGEALMEVRDNIRNGD